MAKEPTTPSEHHGALAVVPASGPAPAPGTAPSPAAAANWLRDMLSALPAMVGQELARQLETAKPPPDPRDTILVKDIFHHYFDVKPDSLHPAVMADRQYTANLFAETHGNAKVCEVTALDVQYFIQGRESWSPGWTRKRILSHLRRIWNWSIRMKLIRADDYPFKGIKTGLCTVQKPLPEDEFQTLMRENPPILRRFFVFLRFSGCRPCEASSMRFSDVDLESPVPAVRLAKHKTDRTGRPRIIILHPVLVKLVRWLMRHRRPEPHKWLFDLLMDRGPTETTVIACLAKENNIPRDQVWRAAKDLGVMKAYIGRRSKTNRHNYFLPGWPDVPESLVQKVEGYTGPQSEQCVFLNSLGNPWTNSNLMRMIARLRRRGRKVGRLYGLRHNFGCQAVKNNVHIKVLASLMGHQTIRSTEIYLPAIGDDLELLSKELQRIPFSSPKPRNQ